MTDLHPGSSLDPPSPIPGPPQAVHHRRWAVGLSVALHLGVVALFLSAHQPAPRAPAPPEPDSMLTVVVVQPPAAPPAVSPASPPPAPGARQSPLLPSARTPDLPPLGRAFMPAPAAPSAEEWALAATYTPKNAKLYRHNWGQQVRSLMGTAHEGPGQGSVRFRIEIAPSGQLARLDTLWATSSAVEQRARAAVQQMPPLPPPPKGQPLVFEKTIVFDAFTAEAPPLYKNDCEPDPPQHGNRFSWDGRSPQVVADQPVTERLDPAAYADCLKQLPQDSIEAEVADNERQQRQWASPTLGR